MAILHHSIACMACCITGPAKLLQLCLCSISWACVAVTCFGNAWQLRDSSNCRMLASWHGLPHCLPCPSSPARHPGQLLL